jgi:hypothetical protein
LEKQSSLVLHSTALLDADTAALMAAASYFFDSNTSISNVAAFAVTLSIA